MLSFRPLNEAKRRTTIRVKASALPAGDLAQQKAIADQLAAECESYCRRLELGVTVPDIEHALAIRAITKIQAAALMRGLPAPAARAVKVERLTLEAAATMHPSTQRTPMEQRWQYFEYLRQFATFAGVEHVADVTLDMVQRWIADLTRRFPSWDTRRHHLMYLRRATRMGATQGMPDVLGDLVLDRRGRQPVVRAWSLDELALGAVKTSDARVLAAIGLGGFLGLRSSEIFRVRCGDLRKDDRLAIGLDEDREAKNQPSRRLLPVPPTVARWIREVAKDRPAGEALLRTKPGRPPNPNAKPRPSRARPEAMKRSRDAKDFTAETYAKWVARHMAAWAGGRQRAKGLRTSCASWATRLGHDRDHVEIILGHESESESSVTGRHYLADVHDLVADEISPTVIEIENHITLALARARDAIAAAQLAPAKVG